MHLVVLERVWPRNGSKAVNPMLLRHCPLVLLLDEPKVLLNRVLHCSFHQCLVLYLSREVY